MSEGAPTPECDPKNVPSVPEEASSAERSARAREAWLASLGILVLLGAVKHLAAAWPASGEFAFTLAAAVQLYLPIYFVGRRGLTRASLGINTQHLRADLVDFAVVAGLTLVFYSLGHHVWQTAFLERTLDPRWPDSLLQKVLLQIFVIALVEEMFFRGYLQERFRAVWPDRWRILGAPVGAAIVVTAAVFALAHFVGEYRPFRLGPFFPALVFGWLRARRDTLTAAVLYHAFCNVLSEVLWTFYRSS